jgi:hypothetical protein
MLRNRRRVKRLAIVSVLILLSGVLETVRSVLVLSAGDSAGPRSTWCPRARCKDTWKELSMPIKGKPASGPTSGGFAPAQAQDS